MGCVSTAQRAPAFISLASSKDIQLRHRLAVLSHSASPRPGNTGQDPECRVCGWPAGASRTSPGGKRFRSCTPRSQPRDPLPDSRTQRGSELHLLKFSAPIRSATHGRYCGGTRMRARVRALKTASESLLRPRSDSTRGCARTSRVVAVTSEGKRSALIRRAFLSSMRAIAPRERAHAMVAASPSPRVSFARPPVRLRNLSSPSRVSAATCAWPRSMIAQIAFSSWAPPASPRRTSVCTSSGTSKRLGTPSKI